MIDEYYAPSYTDKGRLFLLIKCKITKKLGKLQTFSYLCTPKYINKVK